MATTALSGLADYEGATAVGRKSFGIALPSLIVSVVALFSFLLAPRSIADPDIWWHLENAKLQLMSRAFLRHDVYSFTAANSRWMNHEWLSEIPYLLGWNTLGPMGVWLVMTLVITAVMMGVLMLAWRDSGEPKAAFLAMVPAILLSTVSFGPRTLLFGWLLLVVELYLLQNFRRACLGQPASKQIWLLPVVFAVWVNTHGSWMIGLVLFALFIFAGLFQFETSGLFAEKWTRAQRATLFKTGAASVAALFCNPYGWRLVLYPFDMAFKQKLNIENVEEWHSVDFHIFRGKVVLVTLALMILFRILRRSRWSLQDAAFAFVGLYAGLTYSRFLFLAAILVTPLLARDLAGWMPYERGKDKRFLNLAILAVFACMILLRMPTKKQLTEQPLYPVAAVQWINQHPLEGNTFNEYLWGGYLTFHAPQVKTYIDSRMDIFEYNGTLRNYLDTIHLNNSLLLLDKGNIHNVFIPTKSPLAYLLFHAQGWHAAYMDDTAVLFTRN